MAMFDSFGVRTGGISRMKSPASPGMTFAASQPTRKIVARVMPPQITAAVTPSGASMAMMTPSCAEHGTPRARSSVTMAAALRLSRIRVVSVAIVSQPRPSTIGSTALPFSPMRRKVRSSITASRGR